MRPEYRFDYAKARPNGFAAMLKGRTTAVILDPDVASVFESPESVNRLLRSLIADQQANNGRAVWRLMRERRPRVLYVEDAAEGIVLVAEGYNGAGLVNVGAGQPGGRFRSGTWSASSAG